MSAERIACVVPALDAELTLPAVLTGVRDALPGVVLIGVDDGSRDGTRAVLERLCDRVLVHPVNRGKGAALRAGFAEALAAGAELVLTIDADGQHDPARAPAFVQTIAGSDIVIGSRARQGSRMPLRRRVSNFLSSGAISAAAGCRIPDAQSGYRLIRARVLAAVAAVGDRYEFETDFLIRAARAGFRITSVPIPTIYGAPSHFREIRDALLVVRTIWHHHVEVPE